MRKLLALYVNELTKIFKRISVLVILILMVVFVGLYTVLSTFSFSSNIFDFVGTSFYDDTEAELAALKEEKADLEKRLASAKEGTSTDAASSEIEASITNIDNDIYILQLCVDNKIERYTDTTFRRNALDQISEYLFNLISLRRQAELDPDMQKLVDMYEKYVADLTDIIKNNDYKAYIEMSKAAVRNSDKLSDDEKEISIEYYDLLYLNDPNGTGKITGLNAALQYIKDERMSLLTGINTADPQKYNMPLSIEDEEYIKNKLAVDFYNVENGYLAAYDMYSQDYSKYASVDNSITFGSIFVAILIMILAGTVISKEIATGSIKSLIIAPVKRWKIMTAKIMALATTTIAALAVLFVFSIGLNTLLFGTSLHYPYVYAQDGIAHELPYILYELSVLGIAGIKVLVYSVFALMLSTITRNSALSVGLSIGTYFGISNVSSILTTTLTGEWTKFIPFDHFNLSNRIFEYSPVYMNNYSGMFSSTVSTSLCFSVVYLIVLTVTMLITSYDSFNHRDIK